MQSGVLAALVAAMRLGLMTVGDVVRTAVVGMLRVAVDAGGAHVLLHTNWIELRFEIFEKQANYRRHHHYRNCPKT